MAVRLLALRAGNTVTPETFLELVSIRGLVVHRVIMWLEGLGQLKNLVASSGIEPSTFLLIAQFLEKLSYLVPPLKKVTKTFQVKNVYKI
jgi:hypothetical protein